MLYVFQKFLKCVHVLRKSLLNNFWWYLSQCSCVMLSVFHVAVWWLCHFWGLILLKRLWTAMATYICGGCIFVTWKQFPLKILYRRLLWILAQILKSFITICNICPQLLDKHHIEVKVSEWGLLQTFFPHISLDSGVFSDWSSGSEVLFGCGIKWIPQDLGHNDSYLSRRQAHFLSPPLCSVEQDFKSILEFKAE